MEMSLKEGPLPPNLTECWEKFLEDEPTLQKLFDHPVLFPLQRRKEMEAMHDFVNSIVKPKIIMEIGADKGGSVWAWATQCPTVEVVIACEIRGTPYGQAMGRALPGKQFLWLPHSSHDPNVRNTVTNLLGDSKIDVLFIDGDKQAFLQDFKDYDPLVRRNGVTMMHDVCDEPMKRAFQLAGQGRFCHTISDVSEYIELTEEDQTVHDSWLRYWQGRSCTVGVIMKAP